MIWRAMMMAVPFTMTAWAGLASEETAADPRKRVEEFLNRLIHQQQERISDLERQMETLTRALADGRGKAAEPRPAAPPAEPGRPPQAPQAAPGTADVRAAQQALHEREQALAAGEAAVRRVTHGLIDRALASAKAALACPTLEVTTTPSGLGWTVTARVGGDQDAALVRQALGVFPEELVRVTLDTAGGGCAEPGAAWSLLTDAHGKAGEVPWQQVRGHIARLPDRTQCQSVGDSLDQIRAFQDFLQRTRMPEPQFWVRDGERPGLCIRRKADAGGWMLRQDRSVADDLGLGVLNRNGAPPAGRDPS